LLKTNAPNNPHPARGEANEAFFLKPTLPCGDNKDNQ